MMSGLFTPFPGRSFKKNDKTNDTPIDPLVSWSDMPILLADEDQFERSAYAAKVAHLINDTASNRRSTVYGLTGEWGSGKTSLVNLIRAELSQLPSNWEVVDYNPWVASDPQTLIEEFYRAIVESLPANEIGKNIKDILQKTLRSIEPVASTLGNLGSLEALITAKVAKSVGETVDGLKGIWQPEQKSWPTLYKEASTAFERLDKRILLIIDDVDRLHTDELALLMKVVRLLGRFPRVNYLLIYDEDSLLATLVESTAVGGDKDDAMRFMEKIVQYPIDVPQLTSHQIEEQLVIMFDRLPFEARKMDEQNDLVTVQREMFGVWEKILTTPRALRRYAALLVNWIRIYHPDEVNTGDLIILATLRVGFPSVYKRLAEHKNSLLTNSPSSVGTNYYPDRDRKFEWEKILGGELEELQIDILGTILSLLFPKLKSATFLPGRGQRPRAISTEVYFDTYVLFQAPQHVINDRELDDLLNGSAVDEGAEISGFINGGEVDQISSFIAKLPDAIERLQSDDERLRAADVLLAVAERVEDKHRRVRMVNLHNELYLQASIALSELDSPEDVNLFDLFFRNTPLNFAVYYLKKIENYSTSNYREAVEGSWGPDAFEEIRKKGAERMLGVLRERDANDCELGPYILDFLTSWDKFTSLQKKLRDGLRGNEFDIVDIGVLFLSTSAPVGQSPPEWKISSFNNLLYYQYVPRGRVASLQSELSEEGIDFSAENLSWSGRKEAVKYALNSGRTDFHREQLGL